MLSRRATHQFQLSFHSGEYPCLLDVQAHTGQFELTVVCSILARMIALLLGFALLAASAKSGASATAAPRPFFFASKRVEQHEPAVAISAKEMKLISSLPAGQSNKTPTRSRSPRRVRDFRLHFFHLSVWWIRWWAMPRRPWLQRCPLWWRRRSASHTFWYCFAMRNLRCGLSPD